MEAHDMRPPMMSLRFTYLTTRDAVPFEWKLANQHGSLERQLP
jgi:hypothetical protein